MKNKLLPVVMILGLTACDDYYRYPCQNPDNWEKQECRKPHGSCTFNNECTEDLIGPQAKELYYKKIN